MPHTLVTGANSFVAAHVINELIAAGHTVTGAVRRSSAGSSLLAEHPEWASKLDFVTVADYTQEGAFNDIFKKKEYDYVVHTAAPVPASTATRYDEDFLHPGVQGNLVLLKGAKAYGKTVKSIVITGSICSITTGAPDDNRKRVYTNESWSDITPEFARTYTTYRPDYIKYCSSKKEAELAIWEFVKSEKPDFSVTVLLPGFVFGPPLQVSTTQNLNLSVQVIYNYFNGTFDELPNTHDADLFSSYIDVRDLAIAHVRSLTVPEAANKRFLVGGEDVTSSLILKTFQGLVEKGELPELKGRLPKDTGKDVDLSLVRMNAKEGNDVLGLELRSAQETFGDMARRMLELEKREGKAVMV